MTLILFILGAVLLIAGAELLVRGALRHGARPLYSDTMAMFVLPLTAVTLAVLGARAWRQARSTTS